MLSVGFDATTGEAIVLSVGFDATTGESFLPALDAWSMGVQARSPLSIGLPFDFHGRVFRSV